MVQSGWKKRWGTLAYVVTAFYSGYFWHAIAVQKTAAIATLSVPPEQALLNSTSRSTPSSSIALPEPTTNTTTASSSPAGLGTNSSVARNASEHELSVSEQLSTIERLLSEHSKRSQLRLSDAVQSLSNLVAREPEARKRVLQELVESIGTPLGETLLAVLSTFNDSELESNALQLAREGATQQQRLAGLELLGRPEVQSQETRAALVEILKTETHANDHLTVAALTALSRRGAAEMKEQTNVIEGVKPYINSTSPQVREQVLKILAEWAPQEKSVIETLTNATRDPDVMVRISAMQCLGQAQFRFEDVRNAIVARLEDTREDMHVRIAAWQALEIFPMDEQAYRAYNTFKQTRQANGIGG